MIGCGGIGNSLTGGSVPTGGRNVTGVAVLPNSTPAGNATVEVRSLPAETLLQQAETNSQGQFTVTGIPTGTDIDITISLPPQNVLQVIVPQSTIASGAGPTVNIGSITATTSIVAAAIILEQMNAPQDATGIIANQTMSLTVEVQGRHFSQNMQNQFIGSRTNINAQAASLMGPVANAELTAMNQSLSQTTASSALYGLLGYVRGAHSRDFQMPANLKQSLINAEVAGTEYSANTVANALQQAGVQQVSAQQVMAASAKERTELTALAASGSSISPFEAFVIAADVNTDGGFQCDQNTLNKFLSNLLGS
jgi:hypothetical protein